MTELKSFYEFVSNSSRSNSRGPVSGISQTDFNTTSIFSSQTSIPSYSSNNSKILKTFENKKHTFTDTDQLNTSLHLSTRADCDMYLDDDTSFNIDKPSTPSSLRQTGYRRDPFNFLGNLSKNYNNNQYNYPYNAVSANALRIPSSVNPNALFNNTRFYSIPSSLDTLRTDKLGCKDRCRNWLYDNYIWEILLVVGIIGLLIAYAILYRNDEYKFGRCILFLTCAVGIANLVKQIYIQRIYFTTTTTKLEYKASTRNWLYNYCAWEIIFLLGIIGTQITFNILYFSEKYIYVG